MIDDGNKKKKVSVRAVKLVNDDGKVNYFTCDPQENKKHMFIGFLSKSSNPNELCMPCCFKKDQMVSDNKVKKNYYMKCIGDKKADENLETEVVKEIKDKIYVLQETNKVQEGRFIFLSKYLNYFFNKVWKNDYKIKNHYLTESNSGFFLKYTVKDNFFFFLSAGDFSELSSSSSSSMSSKTLFSFLADFFFFFSFGFLWWSLSSWSDSSESESLSFLALDLDLDSFFLAFFLSLAFSSSTFFKSSFFTFYSASCSSSFLTAF